MKPTRKKTAKPRMSKIKTGIQPLGKSGAIAKTSAMGGTGSAATTKAPRRKKG